MYHEIVFIVSLVRYLIITERYITYGYIKEVIWKFRFLKAFDLDACLRV